ncbi:MAG TPA: type II toxin-antitoxin system Phd/YefM family antitoxin [Solirubrobacteraceae bacterium]|jgi:prevent-host-death family protein|nr:type II toxin-antitoxin system Phd/YefM family antitoxin [Solirubrobacteraceae bacterium]
MTHVGMHEAKTQLSKLVERVQSGEEIVITRNGQPAAKLVPAPKKRPISEALGIMKGQIWMADDFDELPDDPEFLEAFGLDRPKPE